MLSRVEELRLISQCVLADDRDAFGRLVEAYQPRVRRFFLNLTNGDVMRTDDLAQETFLKAYVNLRSFRGLAGFSTWLFRIAYNEFYTTTRQRHELPEEAATCVPDTDNSSNEAALTVRQALAQLNEVERTAITLFYIEDMPMKKIVKIMQLPENTIKSHLRRGKQHMKQVIGDR